MYHLVSVSSPVSWETQAGVFLTGLELLAEARRPMLESSTQSSSLQAVPSRLPAGWNLSSACRRGPEAFRWPSDHRATLLLPSFQCPSCLARALLQDGAQAVCVQDSLLQSPGDQHRLCLGQTIRMSIFTCTQLQHLPCWSTVCIYSARKTMCVGSAQSGHRSGSSGALSGPPAPVRGTA